MVRSVVPVCERLFTSSSGDQQAFGRAFYALKHGPVVRADKVADVQTKIKSGAYKESDLDTAIERLLDANSL